MQNGGILTGGFVVLYIPFTPGILGQLYLARVLGVGWGPEPAVDGRNHSSHVFCIQEHRTLRSSPNISKEIRDKFMYFIL